jgi:hypothetical protein
MEEEKSKSNSLQPILEDRLLQFLASFADINIEIGVTLYVGGLIISGTIIGIRRYLELFSESVRTSTGNNKELIDLVASFFDRLQIPEDKEISEAFEREATFIHLRDVVIIQTSAPPQEIKIPLTRIKIASVDGFSLGCLAITK